VRVALLSYNARSGDAIGNQIAEKLAFFLDSGADVRVFVESDQGLHPLVRPHARLLPPEPHGEGGKFLRGADLVVVDYSQGYALLGLLPLLVAERPRVLLDYHGVTPLELWGGSNPEALANGQRWRGLVWFADGALVHSRFGRDELLKPTGFPANRTTTLGYPVEVPATPLAPPRHLRERLGVADDVRLLLYVGRLAKNKRAPLLAEVLGKLADRTPAVHAVVIGDNTDVYRLEAEACQARATELGIADRLHILGRVSDTELRDAYRRADVFVMPSVHEGFCIPVIEAMASGLPVVAAAAAALPETVADAGLTFLADDVEDFARQVGRVLDAKHSEPMPTQSRAHGTQSKSPIVAIVAPRYGEKLAGGAERSLRTIAETLRAAGVPVEVFTTCARREGTWANDLPEGTEMIGGVPVHRFAAEATPSLRSPRLLDALRERGNDFNRIVVGPYLFDLTRDVAQAFPDKAIVVPCFHDEPAIREPACRAAYEPVGGILYHSAEEAELAHAEIGLNHPGAHVIGTHIDVETRGAAARGRALVGANRYVVYCGRTITEKGLPLLLEFARDYNAAHPDRFTFVFMGEGNVPIPRTPGFVDLGYVDEATKPDVLAGAAALIHASERESLSLVCLEAWAQAAPVIGHAGCAVLRGHFARGNGGRAFPDAVRFAALLDDLWQNPDAWSALGRQGQAYVRKDFGSAEAYRARLLEALASPDTPLVERMRERGRDRAARFRRDRWRSEFSAAVEAALDAPPRIVRENVQVTPRGSSRTVSIATRSTLIPVRLNNQGTHPVVTHGPARMVLRSYLWGEAEQNWRVGGPDTPLPGLLLPGQSVAAALPVSVPTEPGVYRLGFRALRAECDATSEPSDPSRLDEREVSTLELHVTAQPRKDDGVCEALLDQVRLAVSAALAAQRLPDDYTEVGHGWLGALRVWIKRKLLGSFKRSYVDVLSRQQSEFNRLMLAAVQELSECCATLDHARPPSAAPAPATSPAGDVGNLANPEVLRHMLRQLTDQLTEAREGFARLQERVASLEAGRGNKRRDVA
jgi:glycosyltransferase involved in cell wall biosynthesis